MAINNDRLNFNDFGAPSFGRFSDGELKVVNFRLFFFLGSKLEDVKIEECQDEDDSPPSMVVRPNASN